MFYGCTAFNDTQVLEWDMSNVSNCANMFRDCTAFVQDVSVWDMSGGNITSCYGMFQGCIDWDESLNSWNFSNATDMAGMFRGCTDFTNGSVVPNWNMSSNEWFSEMFMSTSSFNHPLTGCTGIGARAAGVGFKSMFQYATGFDQNIGFFDMTNVKSGAYGLQMMLFGVGPSGNGLSTANYNETLVDWEAQSETADLVFHGGSSTEDATTGGHDGEQEIVDLKANGWSITDGHGAH